MAKRKGRSCEEGFGGENESTPNKLKKRNGKSAGATGSAASLKKSADSGASSSRALSKSTSGASTVQRREFSKERRLPHTIAYSSRPSNASEDIFPPTLFTNIEYSNGIFIRCTGNSISLPQDYMVAAYGNANYPYSPLLSQPEIWAHKFSAVEAARHGFPLPVFRLLGTITRTIRAIAPPSYACGKTKPQPFTTPTVHTLPVIKRFKITKQQATKQAMTELSPNHTLTERTARISQIQDLWNIHWSPEGIPKLWDSRYGHILPDMVHDDRYIPLQSLVTWNFDETLEVVELYHGLRTVPVDTRSVLNSLAELQSPLGLYHVPLIMTYPRLSEATNGTFELEIGVYAHRLLPEVLLEQDLLKVMTALDSDSYSTTEPIHVPPTPPRPAFASSALPKLVFHPNETMENDAAEATMDLTLRDSTRETPDVLSAFTIPGLLKLWENTGNDVSEWPQLEPIVKRSLTMSLLLHQQHALCWMRQMESLGGFGINSILWEEREWQDGGKYYYSPALGQLRLDRPATMHGGILADEMGLGKTIMILALIVTTLDELKCSGSHATLIVVPPALMWQWKAEISKVAPQLLVQLYNAGVDNDISHEADIVLTTYQVVENNKASRYLRERRWGRIVLDEMQEIRSSSTMIARNCDKLKAGRRWMLSGTPLYDGIEDLRGELNFLSLEPYAAKSEDGFFDFSITNHWYEHSKHGLDTVKVLGLLLLRRTKTMTICATGAPLMGLKPMTIEFVPVLQTSYERALYCFLEYIIATFLCNDEECAGGVSRLSLRLLRELCISPILLAGGLGVGSELIKLDNLVQLYNRRFWNGSELDRGLSQARTDHTNDRALSCADAIRYLSQVQSKVQTPEDFVTDLNLGAGGGMAKRNRAVDSLEERRNECHEKLGSAQDRVKWARATKARAYWHRALERITMGQISLPSTVGRSIAALWRWRAAVQGAANVDSKALEGASTGQCSSLLTGGRPNSSLQRSRAADQGVTPVQAPAASKKLSTLLVRGWRPSKSFVQTELPKNHPDFGWTHPVALALYNIPCSVEPHELHTAIANLLGSTRHKLIFKSNGMAILQLNHADQAQILRQHAKKGIPVKTTGQIPFVNEALKECKTAYEQAKKENAVYSTIQSRKRVKDAQRQMEIASQGLLIVLDEDSSHIRLMRIKEPPRTLHPRTAVMLFNMLEGYIKDSNTCLDSSSLVVMEQSKLMKNLERATEVSDDIKQMSAFESLEAISFKEYEKTMCVICMGFLGSSDNYKVDESKPGLIGLTPCCHLFCASCISDYVANTDMDGAHVKCPTCRKDIGMRTLLTVDPSLCTNLEESGAKLRLGAKLLIQKAAKMLEESNGQLDQDMWLQLFLSIDPPTHVSERGDPRIAAIPREVISFFRAATCFEHVHNNAAAIPSLEPGHGFSSKIQALFRDLPRTERSVIFTSSRTAVQHLMALSSHHYIGYRSVFSGQSPVQAERAVFEWKQSSIGDVPDSSAKESTSLSPMDNPLVLIVQSGAAASGLTLTAACKMFFLEPFVRQEEEHQAFARCHRYGQNDAVHAKVYFSPVSVESRLLEWRKQVANASRADTQIVYSDVIEVDESEEEDLDITEETDQTMFLLGMR